MKVILVAPHFHPRVGGVETYTLRIATGLAALGWQVVIVTTGDRGVARQATVAGLKMYRLPAALTASNTPAGFRWRRRLRRIYQAERPDVINAHTPVPYLADVAQRASKRIPFVVTYHNDLYKTALMQKAVVWILQRTMISRTLRRADGIIATSDYYVKVSPYLRKHAAKTRIVPPGVDLAIFNPDVVVAGDVAGGYAGRRVILFAGSLNRSQQYKGLDVLISAFARIRGRYDDACLVVAGGGDGLAMYQAMAAASGVAGDVHFVGYLEPARLAQYYKLATIFAMPSTNRTEGFGIVYAEAGAVGVPVIGARAGGVPYAVRHEETGLLVAPESVDDLCQALSRLLDDEALARRLGQAGAARARAEFDWAPLTGRTSEILAGFSEAARTRTG